MDNKNDEDESRFLEAPFVRMLRMRSASLKINFSPKGHIKINIKFKFFLHKQSVNHWVCYQTRHALVGNLARSVEIAEKK